MHAPAARVRRSHDAQAQAPALRRPPRRAGATAARAPARAPRTPRARARAPAARTRASAASWRSMASRRLPCSASSCAPNYTLPYAPSQGRAHPRLGRVLAQHGVQAAAVQREQLRQQRHVAAHRGRLLLLALAQVAVQALRARP